MSTMNFDLIPPARTVICVCHVGGRSAAVASALDLAGFSVFNLVGGMVAWAAAGLPVVDDGNQPGSVV
jgi:rhodanese-related sulfurtransferase